MANNVLKESPSTYTQNQPQVTQNLTFHNRVLK